MNHTYRYQQRREDGQQPQGPEAHGYHPLAFGVMDQAQASDSCNLLGKRVPDGSSPVAA